MVKCLKVQRSSRSRNCCLPIETEFIWSKNYRFFMAQFFLVDRDVFFLFVVCMHIYIYISHKKQSLSYRSPKNDS